MGIRQGSGFGAWGVGLGAWDLLMPEYGAAAFPSSGELVRLLTEGDYGVVVF